MEDQKEMKIPVFTVWKNNAILKNIFLVNSPPLNQVETHQQNDEICKTHQQFVETLLVGRHPDCDIRLEHPSISRFHLRIHSIPSSKQLFLTDLSSVHGTWVSGKRIDPNIRTKVNESDSLRVGGSSRVYKLQWIPLSQAYDVSNPFVPPVDFVEPQEDEAEENKEERSLGLGNEEVQAVDSVSKGLEFGVVCDDKKLVIEQVAPQTEENGMAVKNECGEREDSDMEGLMSLLLDENPELFVVEETPPDPPAHKVNSEIDVNEYVLDSVLESLVPLFLGENWEWVEQEANYMACPTEEEYPESLKKEDTGSLETLFKSLDTSFLDENPELNVKHENMGSIESVLDSLDTSVLDENSELILKHEDTGSLETVLEGSDTLFLNENSELSVLSDLPVPEDIVSPMTLNLNSNTAAQCSSEFVSGMIQNDNKFMLQEEDTHKVIQSAPSMTEDMAANLDSSTAGERGSKLATETIQNENEIPLQEADIQDGMWSFWCRSLVLPTSTLAAEGDLLCNENSDLDIDIPQNEFEPKVLSEKKCLGSVNVYQNSSVKDHNMTKLWSFWSGNMGVESSVCSSLSDAGFLSESENKSLANGCQSPPLSSIKRTFGSPLLTSDQKSASSIWSRRGKLQSTPQILTSRSEGKKMKSGQKKVKHEPLSRALFHVEDDHEEDELFTPDKENFTPNTHKSMRKLAMLDEVKNSSSAKMIGSPRIYYEDNLSPSSDKENFSPRTSLKQKKARRASGNQVKTVHPRERKEERMPFQSLLADSPQKCTSETYLPDAAKRNRSSVTCAKATSKTCLPYKCSGEKIRKWSILVDTTTLLNKESRKALQLLEGLKGTQLVIPRIVLRDLASLKRQTSFFRRNTEVSLALGWIEDCMVRTQWWIHVQNSMEEEQPVAPTPPASPYSQVSYGTTGSFTFSALESQPLLLSPTVEDHVLDYAISFKKNKNDGQLILLSNDVTLKIKAMAEGIICETAEEFRESLVNPFSERFLWADSSPRGQTWSCSDDFVLREKFYPSSLKMTPKAMENVKGLKLILLHNSQYYERMTATH
ncbi:FHA domain-containing protein PS1 [Bienertia sinuspersici]